MTDREDLIEQAAEVLFPVVHGEAARAIAAGESEYSYDQSHVVYATALVDAGWSPAECAHCAALRQLNEISADAQVALKRADQTMIMKPAQQEES